MLFPGAISLFEMTRCLSDAADLVSPLVAGHQKRVAFIACSLARELGLPPEKREDLLLAGLLHDIGALSLQERIGCLGFEDGHARQHAEAGYRLLRQARPLAAAARLIRHHHLPWAMGGGRWFAGEEVPLESHLLHLADRIDVLIECDQDILCQVSGILTKIAESSGSRFIPEQVEALRSLAVREHFWFEVGSPLIDSALDREYRSIPRRCETAELAELARVFGHTIDFRCRYTSVHSSGVAVVGREIGTLLHWPLPECSDLEAAGRLHDFGKLALPAEILEKPASLSVAEYNQVKRHPFLAYRLLEPVAGLGAITDWVSHHHERVDGGGYPFRVSGRDLSLGARILTVADVFTALTEDRPYRNGMVLREVLAVLRQMAVDGALDGDLVALLAREAEHLDGLRRQNQAEESARYREFSATIHATAGAFDVNSAA